MSKDAIAQAVADYLEDPVSAVSLQLSVAVHSWEHFFTNVKAEQEDEDMDPNDPKYMRNVDEAVLYVLSGYLVEFIKTRGEEAAQDWLDNVIQNMQYMLEDEEGGMVLTSDSELN